MTPPFDEPYVAKHISKVFLELGAFAQVIDGMISKSTWRVMGVVALVHWAPLSALAQVAELDVQPRSVTMGVGERREVLATAYDAQGNNVLSVSFRWASGDTSVVRVEEDPGIAGVAYLIGIGPGLTQVQVSVGRRTRSVAVSVSGAAVAGPTGTGPATVIEVEPPTLSLLPAEDVRLQVRFLKDDGSLAAPTTVTWRSFNPAVAAVSPEGVVTGVSTGNTLIEAVAASGIPPRRITVAVTQAEWAFANPVVAVAPTESDTVRVIVPDQGGRRLDPRLLSWRSADPNVVAVSPVGVVTGVSTGRAEITAIGFGQEMRLNATVHRPVARIAAAPDPTAPVFVPMGGTVAFSAIAMAVDDSPVPEAPLVWEVGDPKLLGFDPATNQVTGREIGSTTVSVRTADGRVAAQWNAQVVATGIALDIDQLAMSLTDRRPLKAFFADSTGQLLSPASQVTWMSSNPQAAAVDAQGMIVPADYGYTEIEASTPWGNADTVRVYVQGEVLVASNRSGSFDIYAFDRSQPDPYPVIVGPGQEIDPAHSPDGTRIAFATDRNGNFEIYVANADGSSPERLTQSAATEGAPVWTPDGSQILYQSDAGGSLQVWIMNADGTDQRPLTSSPGENFRPAVSPNGKSVAFTSTRDRNHEVYLMDLDGGNQRNFTGSPDIETSPEWIADDVIAFLRERTAGREVFSQVVQMNFQREVTELSEPTLAVVDFAVAKDADILAAIVSLPGPTGQAIKRLYLLPLGGVGTPVEVSRAGELEEFSHPTFRH